MGIVRFALKFPHTFFVLAALILVRVGHCVHADGHFSRDQHPRRDGDLARNGSFDARDGAAGHNLQPIFDLDER
jgi:hypothetical protein